MCRSLWNNGGSWPEFWSDRLMNAAKSDDKQGGALTCRHGVVRVLPCQAAGWPQFRAGFLGHNR